MTSIKFPNPFLFYQSTSDILKNQYGKSKAKEYTMDYNNCRGCNTNLTSNDPASQYQRQKIIQNTVGVASSLYTMNLEGLAGYEKPLSTSQIVEQAGAPYYVPPKVYWNQMSDRARPAVQVTKVASGSTYHTSSTKHTITRNRPGAMSPGGIGVDIKHNSYQRYLNKLKGAGPLRRGVIPKNYGDSIPFDRVHSIHGGKVVNTSIITGCNCPDVKDDTGDKIIYGSILNAIQDQILSVGYTYSIGDFVWAKKYNDDKVFNKARIIDITNGIYKIEFEDGLTKDTTVYGLLIYFDCNCSETPSLAELIVATQNSSANIVKYFESQSNIWCKLLNVLTASEIL